MLGLKPVNRMKEFHFSCLNVSLSSVQFNMPKIYFLVKFNSAWNDFCSKLSSNLLDYNFLDLFFSPRSSKFILRVCETNFQRQFLHLCRFLEFNANFFLPPVLNTFHFISKAFSFAAIETETDV
jgi:hypothetical protein